MNYIILGIQIFLTFFLIFLSYKLGKKDGLYLAIALFSSIICIMLFKMINVLDFDINMGIPFIVGILILNNIIVHRYGFDELKRIMYTFGISYILTYIVIFFNSLFCPCPTHLILKKFFWTFNRIIICKNITNIKIIHAPYIELLLYNAPIYSACMLIKSCFYFFVQCLWHV